MHRFFFGGRAWTGFVICALALVVAAGCSERAPEPTAATGTTTTTTLFTTTTTPTTTAAPTTTQAPTTTKLRATPTSRRATTTTRRATTTSRRATTTSRRTTTTAAAARNCDPAYPDACLREGIGDYDCAGGSGNGPNYVDGPIQVLPPDPFDLDRDGDGVGCES